MRKLPKYCYYCGSEVELYLKTIGFNEQNGNPIYRIGVDCRACRSKGIVVYFGDYYPIPKGFDISKLIKGVE